MSLTKKILEKIKDEISKEDFNQLLLSPLYNCIYPYYITIIIFCISIFVLLILILFVLMFKK